MANPRRSAAHDAHRRPSLACSSPSEVTGIALARSNPAVVVEPAGHARGRRDRRLTHRSGSARPSGARSAPPRPSRPDRSSRDFDPPSRADDLRRTGRPSRAKAPVKAVKPKARPAAHAPPRASTAATTSGSRARDQPGGLLRSPARSSAYPGNRRLPLGLRRQQQRLSLRARLSVVQAAPRRLRRRPAQDGHGGSGTRTATASSTVRACSWWKVTTPTTARLGVRRAVEAEHDPPDLRRLAEPVPADRPPRPRSTDRGGAARRRPGRPAPRRRAGPGSGGRSRAAGPGWSPPRSRSAWRRAGSARPCTRST